MLAALDAVSAAAGFAVGFVAGLVIVLALSRRGEPWRLDWRLQIARGRQHAPEGLQDDESAAGAVTTQQQP